MTSVRKHHRGCYRVTLTPDEFGQVKREGQREWLAELRDTRTGDLIRYAGLWPTLWQAIAELRAL